MYHKIKNRIEQAIQALKNGEIIIVTDDKNRENEGDLIFPGQIANTKNINFLLQHTTGIICLAMSKNHAKKLKLTLMVKTENNSSQYGTPFTISIEAKTGVTTGVSAKDRAHTIKTASNPLVNYNEITKPGHIFPLISHPYGVLNRKGHTEGSIDIIKLSGFYPCAVLSELMNNDGSMMKGKQITNFAKKYNLTLLSIEDIRLYRLTHEIIIKKNITTLIPFKTYGTLNMSVFYDPISQQEIVILSKNIYKYPFIRIHSSCMTGDLFGSLKCDCQSQLYHALQLISQYGGHLIYLNQEGRNIGLTNKLKAYELQRKIGLNTIEANEALGLPVDNRNYDLAIQVLKYLNIIQCYLITNNPKKSNP